MSGSRAFFLVMVVVSLGLTGWLVGGALTQQGDAMSADAAAGMVIWRANGCEGCHTLYGQGGGFAPDLTHIVSLRGEDYLHEFMINPGAYHPNQRAMPRFNLTRDEITRLIAFLSYAGGSDGAVVVDWFKNMQISGTGGLSVSFLPQTVASSAGLDPAVARGKQIFAQRCASCHSLDEGVVQIGPSLWGIADRAWHRVNGQIAEQYIRNSILNPGDYVVEGFGNVMAKNLGEILNSTDVDNVIAFLMTMQETQ